MRAFDSGNLYVPKWLWILAAASAVMIASGLLWTGPTTVPAKIGTEPVCASPDCAARPNPAVAVMAPRLTLAGIPAPGPSARITSAATAKPAPRAAPVCAKPILAPPATPKSMFPVGPIAPGPTVSYHPYSQPREEFASFGYGHKLWSFVGRYVRADQVDIAPIGYNLSGRTVYAIANTAGPGSVLFVRSAIDPGRLAVYRHS